MWNRRKISKDNEADLQRRNEASQIIEKMKIDAKEQYEGTVKEIEDLARIAGLDKWDPVQYRLFLARLRK